MQRLQQLMEPFMKNHLVHNLQFETYQREVERYGFDTMEQSEDIFYYQSLAVLNFIPLLYGDEGEQYRWQVAMKAIDLFLDDFHYTTEQKRDLVKLLYENFSNEFKIGAPQQKKISERFSSNKQLIQKLMDEATGENENLNQAIGFFNIKDENYHNAINEILHAPSIHHDIGQINRLMQSYLHMFVNRIAVSNQRKMELVFYDYLLKFYESKIAREKNKKIKSDTEVKADIV
jgi:thiopeptide-type bacteriocin biosynthesis protein